MHASSFIAILAASVASATPLMARNTPATYASAPSGAPTAPASYGASGSPAGGSDYKPSDPKPSEYKPSSSSVGWEDMTPVATSVLGNPNATPNPVTPKGLVGELLTQDSTVARFKQIKEEIDAGTISLVFDHNPAANPNVTAGEGGQVDLANQANFPVLTGLGISSATVFFQPCGLNTPHVHPRATEFFTLATDTKMTTGFVLENGETDEFTAKLGIWQGTVFPQGSIHWQQNDDCKPAVGIAGLNAADPGASSIAQNFLRFTNPAVVDAALGFPAEINAENFAKYADALPTSLAQGVKECLVRCNIKY